MKAVGWTAGEWFKLVPRRLRQSILLPYQCSKRCHWARCFPCVYHGFALLIVFHAVRGIASILVATSGFSTVEAASHVECWAVMRRPDRVGLKEQVDSQHSEQNPLCRQSRAANQPRSR